MLLLLLALLQEVTPAQDDVTLRAETYQDKSGLPAERHEWTIEWKEGEGTVVRKTKVRTPKGEEKSTTWKGTIKRAELDALLDKLTKAGFFDLKPDM